MVFKRCGKSQKLKLFTEFNKARGSADGLDPRCKECRRVYRQQHSSEISDYYRNWSADNPQIKRKADRRWLDAQPGGAAASWKFYREQRKKDFKGYYRQWLADNP